MLTKYEICLIMRLLKTIKGLKMNRSLKCSDWLGKILYAMMVSAHHEDYISEGANGKIVRTPASVWHATALENCHKR